MQSDLESAGIHFSIRLAQTEEELDARLQAGMGRLICWSAGIEPEGTGGEAGRFAYLHYRAVQLLIEAELFSCGKRTRILFEIAEKLQPEALPPDFFNRLAVVHGKVLRLGNKGPRNPDRDDTIRGRYSMLRHGYGQLRERAIETVAEEVGLSPESVERIVDKPMRLVPQRDLLMGDLVRIGRYVGAHYPSKPLDPPLGAGLIGKAIRADDEGDGSRHLINRADR